MLRRKTVSYASSNYGSDKFVPLPEHQKWRLGDFLQEMSEFYKCYGANGGGSYLEVYRCAEDCDSWFARDKRIYNFHFAQGYNGLVESNDTKDPAVMDLEIFCDFGFGFWGCDTWYAYLADSESSEHITESE